MKIVTIVLLLCAFGCSNKEELPDNSNIEEKKPIVRMPTTKKNDKTVEIYLDKMSFSKAFNIQRRAKGEGKTFWWRGKEYIILLKREEI